MIEHMQLACFATCQQAAAKPALGLHAAVAAPHRCDAHVMATNSPCNHNLAVHARQMPYRWGQAEGLWPCGWDGREKLRNPVQRPVMPPEPVQSWLLSQCKLCRHWCALWGWVGRPLASPHTE